METTKAILQTLVQSSPSKNKIFKRNILKEYLQVVVLNFVYSHPVYSDLIFYGGSCLSQCFNLPRLSEDLDFIDLKNKINLKLLAKDLENYLKKETDLNVYAISQKFRIYLKFPILYELELATKSESDLLFLKVEVFKNANFCKNYRLETIPLFKFNKSILIRTFDLSTLMATKIRAIFYRKWEKTDKQGKILVSVKGRDYFDLMWYLQKGITPNLDCLEEVKNINGLKEKLLQIIERIDTKSIQLDLEAFIENKNFVINLGKNIKDILKKDIMSKI